MKKYRLGILFLILAIIFTILVKTIDTQPIGPEGTFVGFATVNSFFKNAIGTNTFLYDLAEILGIIPIASAVVYAIIGFIQLVKRKNITKVDPEIIALGVFYIVTLLVYAFFEKFVINYRPILIDNNIEASYPSSHTMFIICLCASSIIINKKLFQANQLAKISNWFANILVITIVFCRFLSGAHWFTDIIGGFLFSLALVTLFYEVVTHLPQTHEH